MIISRKRYERDIERARYEQDKENDRIKREEEHFARTYNLERETERLAERIERLETDVHNLMVIGMTGATKVENNDQID